MKSLIKSARLAFRAPAALPLPPSAESRRQTSEKIVRSLARGNIRLQRGDYVTKEDIDREYERIKSYQFDD